MLQVDKPTIKCPKCGTSTGLNPNGFHKIIPPGGLKCVCGQTIISKPEIRM